jgi:hypothetical protein
VLVQQAAAVSVHVGRDLRRGDGCEKKYVTVVVRKK